MHLSYVRAKNNYLLTIIVVSVLRILYQMHQIFYFINTINTNLTQVRCIQIIMNCTIPLFAIKIFEPYNIV